MEAINEELEDWREHPVTRRKAKSLKDETKELHQQLLSCCASSSDPSVTAAFARYRACATLSELMGGHDGA